MAYNVTAWKTKELVDLKIPVSSLFKHPRKDWHPERIDYADGSVRFEIVEASITGHIDGELLIVDSMNLYGDGSGTALEWITEPALKDSTGKLVAIRIWEGGDYIDKLTVIDGVLDKSQIEL